MIHREEDSVEHVPKFYIVVLHDRHCDDEHHVCDSFARANEILDKFMASYGEIHDANVTWTEQKYEGYLRWVSCYDDGPKGFIVLKELNK